MRQLLYFTICRFILNSLFIFIFNYNDVLAQFLLLFTNLISKLFDFDIEICLDSLAPSQYCDFIFNINFIYIQYKSYILLLNVISHCCRHAPLEDMIDNVFISDERLERESAMYRIMTDSFTDPFEGIESDYADVDIELIKKYLREDGEEVSSDIEYENQQEVKDGDNSCMEDQETSCVKEQGISCVEEQETSCVKEQGIFCVEEQETSCMEEQQTSCVEEQEKSYVPGIRKLSFCFPRRSRLDKIQQAMCLRVLLRLSNNEKKKMNIKERKELNQYMVNRH